MSEGSVARAGSLALFVALASCATAQEADLSGNDPSGAGTSNEAGASGSASHAGASNGASGASSAGANSAGAPAAGGATASAGAHSGGSSAGGAGNSGGASAGGSSAGSAGSAGKGGNASGGSASGGAANGGSATGGSVGAAGSGGAGAVLFSDDFEDGNATGWTVSDGTWAVVSDGSKVYSQSATGSGSTLLLAATGSTSWTNQIVEAKVKVKAFGGSSTSYSAAILGRYTGSDYYALALRSDGKVAIRHGNSTIGSAVTAGIVEGTWYKVRLEIVGSSLKAYVDGALKDSETDTSISAGGIAVSTVNTTAEFDDVKVTTP
jgi:hypothetical protein